MTTLTIDLRNTTITMQYAQVVSAVVKAMAQELHGQHELRPDTLIYVWQKLHGTKLAGEITFGYMLGFAKACDKILNGELKLKVIQNVPGAGDVRENKGMDDI
ncbi:MAG: hypothetical protein AMJ75_00465 [Phycisphaerae bacterium SM1_79]|nr:MAG: hypothetical protein AMJ75_00465 [Phycisphaerae bacterium SM1_79]